MGGVRVPVRPVLEDVGRINALFALEEEPPGPGWVSPGGAGRQVLAAEVERVRARSGPPAGHTGEEVEWRVAASLFQQGLATRILSPVLAAALCHGVLLDAARFRWDPHREGPLVLRTSQETAEAVVGGPRRTADRIEAAVLLGVLTGVARSLSGTGRVAPGLLRGNTASALAGAARSLGAARPERRAEAEALVGDLLGRTALKGTGGYAGTDAGGAGVFRRTTCCLYYRLPGGGYCGDCALRP
ncbi:(2Fe-2S)-binding protein [Nocardiopsis tropica]|uniref:(2Fe-2S)-binding protein n=1 Tax=Nocardiopsis tropica TaxID=109330 RepID=UPI002E88F032|nr:(2Fe-2S)-binding protein [Nocardiopsis tropica]